MSKSSKVEKRCMKLIMELQDQVEELERRMGELVVWAVRPSTAEERKAYLAHLKRKT